MTDKTSSTAFQNMTETMLGLVDNWVWYGSHSVRELDEQIDADHEGDFDIEQVKAFAAERVSKKLATEAQWPQETDCDRLDRAFDRLEAQGICALHFPASGYTMRHGWDAVLRAVNADNVPEGRYVGFCYYHAQDIDDALNGDGLMVAFGSLVSDDHEDDIRIGRRVCAALEQEGLQTDWNGTADSRIALPAMRWQRRMPD
jgi:hypothetical protein